MKLFGTTIQETISAFGVTEPKSDILGARNSSGQNADSNSKIIAIGRLLISILLLSIAAFLFYVDKKSQPAVAIIGLVAGYWLK